RNVHLEENKPAMLIIGCHHAREWISVEVPLLFCRHLLDNADSNTDIKAIIDSGEVWIVPIVNPDGLEYSIHSYRYWRKNRRNNGAGSFGVDPNRNYGYMWGYDENGSSSDPDSEVYRGTGAFSEPEAQAIRDLFPLQNFRALISFHSYSQVILYPWGYKHDPSADEGLLVGLARQMADLMRPVNGRDYGVERAGDGFYLTNGDTTDWAYGEYGIPAYTIELPPIDQLYGGFFNSEADIQTIFAENLPALLFLLNWAVVVPNSDLPLRSLSPEIGTKRKPGKVKSPRK
ncbi:MAG: M14 family metallopeptidase, partial [Candidatus Aminicenantes bacterium]|nr:M14 family metallopeptidase [Candidatus Aminicenantes bacterium]